jgi:hypothetical protein
MRPSILRRTVAALLFSAAALCSPFASAAVPSTVTHQGRLYDASGKPITGTLSVKFALYASVAATTSIWTETYMVTFDQGYFSVELGSVTPLDTTVLDGSTLYLGITVGTDPEMTPRSPVASVPYAILAGDVNGDIHPTSVSINGMTVIDSGGKWVGNVAGLQGTQGPQGPQGAQGAQGSAGPVGPTGTAGAVGATGPQGGQGTQGPQGVAGPQGAVGPQGPAGPVGPSGAQGIQGPAGAAGPAGAVGAAGPVGPTGPQGPQGSQGVAGPQGAQGSTGLLGPTGPQGPQGAVGSTGLQGPQGVAGPTGAQGPQGVVGPTGPTDPTQFIQNQNTGAQAASFDISGTGQIQALTVNGDITVGGRVAIGIYVKSCTPTSNSYDCACNAGDYAVGGGGYAYVGGGNVLRESDPSPGNTNAWRTTCAVVSGGSSSFDNPCQGSYALCLAHAQ